MARGKLDTIALAKTEKEKEIIRALWREYYGMYNEKYKGDETWLRNEFSELIDFGQAIGQANEINGEESAAIGFGNITRAFREIIIGSHAEDTEAISADTWNVLDLLLSVGNGADKMNRSSMIKAYKSGLVKLANALQLAAYNHGVDPPADGFLQYLQKKLSLSFDGEFHNLLTAPAPDGKKYVIKDGEWLELIAGGDGLTPFIGENSNWWIGTTDTGVKAEGDDGREIEVSTSAGYIVWRYVGDISWIQLYQIPAGAPSDGKIYGQQDGVWKGNLMPLPITATSEASVTEQGHTHPIEGVIVVIDDGEDPVTTIINGYLYPFLAIQDSRGLTAANAHVPTDEEWHALSLALDPATDINEVQNYSLVAGGMLLEGGSTGFNAKYSGIRDTEYDATGVFTAMGSITQFWTATQYPDQPYGWVRSIIAGFPYEGYLHRNAFHNTCGFSIRLIVDAPIEISGSRAIYVGNDLQRYNCKLMPDGKWWTLENLCETKWRNLELITEIKEDIAWLANTGDARCAYVNIEANAKIIIGGPVDVVPGGTVIITRKLVNMIPDADHVTVSESEKASWNAKQAAGNYITVNAANEAYAPISILTDIETILASI